MFKQIKVSERGESPVRGMPRSGKGCGRLQREPRREFIEQNAKFVENLDV